MGHVAVGFAAKRAAPHLPLGLLVGCALLLDLVWPIFLLAGVESVRVVPGATAVTPLDLKDYPYTHSLVGALGWSLLVATAVYAARKRLRYAAVTALCVISHWILDFVTHAADMPLYPGSRTFVGLGLWRSIAGTIFVEGALTVACVLVYVRATKASDGVGRWGLAVFLAFVTAVYFANIFGPPPPDARAIAYAALLMWLFLPWTSWIDRHRAVIATPA